MSISTSFLIKSVFLIILSACLSNAFFLSLISSSWLHESFSFIKERLWLLSAFCLVPLFYALFRLYRDERKSLDKKIILSMNKRTGFSILFVFLYGFLFELISFNWIQSPMVLFTDLPVAASYLIYFLVCFLSAVYYVILFIPLIIFIPSFFKKTLTLTDVLFFSVLPSVFIVIFEVILPRFFDWSYAVFFSFNPNLLVYSQYFGPSSLAVVIFWTGIVIAALLSLPGFTKRTKIISFWAILILWVLIDRVGAFIVHTKREEIASYETARVAFVQPNFHMVEGQTELLGNRLNSPSLESLIHKSFLAVKKAVDFDGIRPQLLVWPESTLSLDEMRDYKNIQLFSQLLGVPILLQDIRHMGFSSSGDLQLRSSSFIIYPDGAQSEYFDKWILMPFGEYVPFEDVIPGLGSFFRKMIFRLTPFERGQVPTVLPIDPKWFVAPLICFDSIDSKLPREQTLNHASFFINQANFMWMGKSTAGQLFSLFIARARAAENGRSLFVVSNSGPSVAFNPIGETILPPSESLTEAYGFVDLPIQKSKTPYTEYDPWLFLGAMIFLFMISIFWLKKRRLVL